MTPAERAYNGDKRHMRPLPPVEGEELELVAEERPVQWPAAVALMVLGLGLFALIGFIVWVIER